VFTLVTVVMGMKEPVNLSFSGAGFLGVYQVGVVSCLQYYGRKLVDRVSSFGGCSAGAFAAIALLCDIDVRQSLALVMDVASKVRDSALGPMSPSFNLCQVLRETFNSILPSNAYKLASGKLFISFTRVSDFQNVVVSEFTSNRDLIDALVCTSFIPFYSGVKPPKYQGVQYVDGGFSDNLLQHFKGTTITVSVFSGDSDICPQDVGSQKDDVMFDMNNATVQVTSSNIHRLIKALLPDDSPSLTHLCRQGFEDTLKYLHHNYPDMLSMDVQVVSVPHCCPVRCEQADPHSCPATAGDDDDKALHCSSDDVIKDGEDQSCLCGGDCDLGFTLVEKQIAQGNAFKSLVLPKTLFEELSRAEKIVGEKDLFWHSINMLLGIVKWLAHPTYYMTSHVYAILHDIFTVLLPRIESYSSNNVVLQRLIRTAKHTYHTYHGTGKCEWHPSLGADRQVEIENTRKRLRSAEGSFVALKKHSILSDDKEEIENRQRCESVLSSDGSELTYGTRRKLSMPVMNSVNEDQEKPISTLRKISSSSFAALMSFGRMISQEIDYGSDLQLTCEGESAHEFQPYEEEEEEEEEAEEEGEHILPIFF